MDKSGIDGTFHPKVRAVGIPWYEEADYPAILALMADANRLPSTFAAWLQNAQKLESQITGQGQMAVRAIIKPQAFAGWCALHGYSDIDAKARSTFAAEQAARQIGL